MYDTDRSGSGYIRSKTSALGLHRSEKLPESEGMFYLSSTEDRNSHLYVPAKAIKYLYLKLPVTS